MQLCKKSNFMLKHPKRQICRMHCWHIPDYFTYTPVFSLSLLLEKYPKSIYTTISTFTSVRPSLRACVWFGFRPGLFPYPLRRKKRCYQEVEYLVRDNPMQLWVPSQTKKQTKTISPVVRFLLNPGSHYLCKILQNLVVYYKICSLHLRHSFAYWVTFQGRC